MLIAHLEEADVGQTLPWSKFRDTFRRLERATSLSGIADAIARSARELLACDGATFVAREGDQCHYVSEDAIGPLWKGLRFPMSSCISGWVMQHGTTAAVEDVLLDPRIPRSAYEPTFARSVIMVPVGEAARASIGFYWKTSRCFDQADIRLAEMLAATVSPVVAHRYAETAFERERERRHLMHEALQLGAWELQFGGCELSSSALFKSHFGRRLDDPFSYRDLLMSIAVADRSRFQQAVGNLVNNGQTWT